MLKQTKAYARSAAANLSHQYLAQDPQNFRVAELEPRILEPLRRQIFGREGGSIFKPSQKESPVCHKGIIKYF